MTARTPQRVSVMPIGKVVSILDAVMASRPNRRWDVDAVRNRLALAAEDGFVETGTAKRILHAAIPLDTLLPNNRSGMGRILQLWNGLKTIAAGARADAERECRAGLHRAIGSILSDGLVTIRYFTHPAYSSHIIMNPDLTRAIGDLADGLHNLPDALLDDAIMRNPIRIGSIRREMAQARRAITRLNRRGW